MTRSSGIKSLAFLSFLILSVAARTNFTQCLIDFKDSNVTNGGTDYHGRPVANSSDAVGLTYEACTRWCGYGQEPFDWSVFSQQFSAWLLPWLALISQLPFGAENGLDNLISGKSPPAPTYQFIPPISSPSYTSHPHYWVPYPRSLLTRSLSHQRSLGLQPFLRHQLP